MVCLRKISILTNYPSFIKIFITVQTKAVTKRSRDDPLPERAAVETRWKAA